MSVEFGYLVQVDAVSGEPQRCFCFSCLERTEDHFIGLAPLGSVEDNAFHAPEVTSASVTSAGDPQQVEVRALCLVLPTSTVAYWGEQPPEDADLSRMVRFDSIGSWAVPTDIMDTLPIEILEVMGTVSDLDGEALADGDVEGA